MLAAATMLAFVVGVLHASYVDGIGACATKDCLCAMHCCHIASALASRTIGSGCHGDNPGTAMTEDAEDAAAVAVSGNASVSPDAVAASLAADSSLERQFPPRAAADLLPRNERSVHLINSVFRI
jgi:hypothetical protein